MVDYAGQRYSVDERSDGYRPSRSRRRRFSGLRILVFLLSSFFALLVAVALLAIFVVDINVVPSAAMAPTIEIGDRILTNTTATSPDRGDIILFRHDDGVQALVKRVIAVGGDSIEIQNNRVSVNGELLDEPYLDPGALTTDYGPEVVPEGAYFVMGDNREQSFDSRLTGPIDGDRVIGLVFRIL